MRCVALLSGGKDSVAAIEVAQNHGWDVVAGLRMLPGEDDSYMFHTPALGVVEGVAQCLGIPLMSCAAGPDPLQEVGELEQALARSKEDFNVDAIISGALASEYQRTRIDAIGHRIGMRSYAPLWHKQRWRYLRELLDAGYDIRFSRVAADGLDESWIGQQLDGQRLARLATMRLDPAGEGGEFETLVLDAPHYRHRIVIDQAQVQATASRATWEIDAWHLEPKPQA